jgi:type IV pilus assembly protein PilO
MEQLIERIAKASLGLKIGVVGAIVAVITVLNYTVIGIPTFGRSIREIEERVVRANNEQAKLAKEFIQKQSIANDLNRFRRERELLEQRLAEASAELPEEKNLNELLQQFEDRATKAGLQISSIEPKEAVAADFIMKLPILMKVDGNFHEIVTFFDALGKLRRIVNVSEISFGEPKDQNGKVVLKASFTATTFMFRRSTGGAAK